MMNRRVYLLVTATVFAIIWLSHLLRILFGWEAVISGWTVPMWLSWVAVVITGVLAYFGVVHGRGAR